jgi:dihydroorotate dehydrogenase
VFRLEKDEAIINRYGFNSLGHTAALCFLRSRLIDYLVQAKLIADPALQSQAIHRSIMQMTTLEDHIQLVEQQHLNKSLREGRLLGINLGKNKVSPAESHDDYVLGIQRFAPYADYLVINVSSPNTPGLRHLQRKSELEALMKQVTFFDFFVSLR